jgi:hypothetical protein
LRRRRLDGLFHRERTDKTVHALFLTGKCLLAIYTSGDLGELCLVQLGPRLETATAMEETTLRRIPCSKFFLRLTNDTLLQGFAQYLVVRIANQQQVIAALVTVDSEKTPWIDIASIGAKAWQA